MATYHTGDRCTGAGEAVVGNINLSVASFYLQLLFLFVFDFPVLLHSLSWDRTISTNKMGFCQRLPMHVTVRKDGKETLILDVCMRGM